MIPLSKRNYPLRPHYTQSCLFHSQSRFNVVPAGRRSGKSELSKRKLVEKAFSPWKSEPPRYFAAAPTYNQAKRIFWQDLKELIPPPLRSKQPSEGNLIIYCISGAEIHVLGMDKPERIEGSPWDGGIVDEIANIKPHAWGANIRPALSDRNGWCWLIGVPEGRNHYYDLYQNSLSPEYLDWSGFTWKSAEILPDYEIEAAKRDLDELTFRQEYEADFVTFQGQVYYCFDRSIHAATKFEYKPNLPLIIGLDFNVSPGVAAIMQEQNLPNGLSGTAVIDEIWIETNSNTVKVCNQILHQYSRHQDLVFVYGDATGGNRGTAKVQGSDWDLVSKILRPVFGSRFVLKVPKANPSVRSRINAVNSRLKSMTGDVRMMIDPRCKQVIKDLEGTRLADSTEFAIDKKNDPQRSHISDGLGYYVSFEFPVRDRKVTIQSI